MHSYIGQTASDLVEHVLNLTTPLKAGKVSRLMPSASPQNSRSEYALRRLGELA